MKKLVKTIIKPCAMLCLLLASSSYAKVSINFTQPELLVEQVHNFDLSHTPMLKSSEQKLVPMLQKELEQKNFKALFQQLKQELNGETPSAAMNYFLGQLSLQLTKPKLAMDYFTAAIKQQPNYAKAIAGAGLAAIQTEQFDLAVGYFSEALTLGVRDPQLYRYLGFSYLEKEQYMSASIAFEQAKMLLPNDTQLDEVLVYSYSNSGQSEAALAMLEQMLVSQPNKAKLWLQRANIYLAKQDHAVTISSLETAIRLGENQASNLALTAQLQLQYGSTPRAIKLYQKIWQGQKDIGSVLDAIGFLIDSYKLNEANTLLTKAKKKKDLAPRLRAEILFLSGKLDFQKSRFKQAEKSLQQALKLQPIHGSALMALAKVHRINNDSHKAQMLLLRASEIPEVQLQALTEHADLQLTLGNTRKALALLREALALKPNEQTLINNVNTLQTMVMQQGS